MAGYFMEMHQDLRMRKALQYTISSTEFIRILTNKKLDKAVKYIYDDKSWERFYVLLRIIFSCLKVISLADSNHAGIDKVYYSYRMAKQCIEKKISDLDYQELFPYL